MLGSPAEVSDIIATIRRAAHDTEPVAGLTHCHYRYPARFSPQFVSAAIENLSKPGDVVLDPYMGGGTTIVEAMAKGRLAVGCDINSLAVFIAGVKTTFLTKRQSAELLTWAEDIVPRLMYHTVVPNLYDVICEKRTRNLDLPRARAIKKFIAMVLLSLDELSSDSVQAFARCALLNVSQWALNGSKRQVSLPEFRLRLTSTTQEMVAAAQSYRDCFDQVKGRKPSPVLVHGSSESLDTHSYFKNGALCDLVVTSPPYPGVHVLYHRWQVDGRKETPAPYWIANCLDGQGASYYNFGSRKQESHDDYFESSLKTLKGIRTVMRDEAVMVQMVAFSDPKSQLPRYLENMSAAGFSEVKGEKALRRIWRGVPRRSWHAELQGNTHSAREVVLIHTTT